MREVHKYTTEDRDGTSDEWFTYDYREAVERARQYGHRVIDYTFVYEDNEVVDDFTGADDEE
jgi:hypothetical protein